MKEECSKVLMEWKARLWTTLWSMAVGDSAHCQDKVVVVKVTVAAVAGPIRSPALSVTGSI